MLPGAPGEECPLPVSSPSAIILEPNSLGWLRTPVPTPKGVGEKFTAGERATREEGLVGRVCREGSPGAEVGAGQMPRQGGRKEQGNSRAPGER